MVTGLVYHPFLRLSSFGESFDERNASPNQALKAFVGGLAPTTTEGA